MIRRFLPALLLLVLTISSRGQHNKATENPVADYVAAHRQSIAHELEGFLAIPNLASDSANIEKNAEAIEAMLKRRGLQTRLLRVDNAPPAVLAWLPPDPSRRTVTFYAHYDGQPVERYNWTQQDPWKPVLVNKTTPGAPSVDDPETRIYARSASDDKAAIIGLLTALDAMQAAHRPLSVNVRFLFEGEEEAGSPHLPAILAKYAGDLQSDLWVICDGPMNQDGDPQLLFGSRGVLPVRLTVFGPNRPLHSGHYGNWAPNPITEIAHLIAKLRTTDAEVLIPHFYDSVRALTPAEKAALKSAPAIDARLKTELALGRTEGHGPLNERIMAPSLNVDRIEGGGSGPNPANAIPSSATAYIDFRLVPDQTPDVVKRQLEDYLHTLGYFIVTQPPRAAEREEHEHVVQVVWAAGYPPQRTPIDAPVSQAFISAVRTVTGSHLVLLPTIGGSTPSYAFEQQFRRPVIVLPIANYDNNQHAANENLKLKNLWEGIELYAAVMGKLGEYWK